MKRFKSWATVPALAFALSAGAANAANVSPDIIFGGGNDNGSFTVTTFSFGGGDIEIGLRAKLRYNDSGLAENTFNWDNTDSYTFAPTAGTPSNRSVFNYEWSVNVEDTGSTIGQLREMGGRAEISFDTDPSSGVNFTSYDPFGNLGTGYYVGDNSTPNGQKKFDSDPGLSDFLFPGFKETDTFGDNLGNSTVAQNSVNYGFLSGAPLSQGDYQIGLSIFNANDQELGSTEISVSVVPVPAAMPLMLTALGGLGFVARRRRKKAA